jgi:hypothetical protein
MVRGLKDRKSVSSSVIHKQISTARKNWRPKNRDYIISANPAGMDVERGSAKKRLPLTDYFLVDLAEGVEKHPEGRSAQTLTRAIRYAVTHGHSMVKLSDAREYMRLYHDWEVNDDYDAQKEDVDARQLLGNQADLYYRQQYPKETVW